MIYNLLPTFHPYPRHTLATIYLIHAVLLEVPLTICTCFTIEKVPNQIPSQPTFLSLLKSGMPSAGSFDTFVVHGLGKGCWSVLPTSLHCI